MWLTGTATIDTHEYTSSSVTTNGDPLDPISQSSISVEPWSLANSLMRSRLNVRLNQISLREQFLLSFAASVKVYSFLGNVGGNLVFNEPFVRRHKDFVATAIRGDTAQAVVFHWLLAGFDDVNILDFDYACASIALPVASGQRPDFACSMDGWRTVLLVESKGRELRSSTLLTDKKQFLYPLKALIKKALTQTAAGRVHLGRRGSSVGAAVLLPPDATTVRGVEIRWADPSDDDLPEVPENIRLNLRRAHYAAWAAAAGLFSFAEWLSHPTGAPPKPEGRFIGDWFVPMPVGLYMAAEWHYPAIHRTILNWLSAAGSDAFPDLNGSALDKQPFRDGTGFISPADFHSSKQP